MNRNTEMSAAPKDRNILILRAVMHYKRYRTSYGERAGYEADGTKWVEARWLDKGAGLFVQKDGWYEWYGNAHTHSTNGHIEDPLAWSELPS